MVETIKTAYFSEIQKVGILSCF